MDYAKLYPIMGFQRHGRIGHLFVFQQYKWGYIVRRHVYPYDPKTSAQNWLRSLMRDAVSNWQYFDQPTQNFYNIDPHTKHMSGYNRYIQLYLKANKDMITYWNDLAKSATDSVKISDYIASPYFVRGLNIQPILWDGWLEAIEAWTYLSADGNIGIFNVTGDVTGKYSKGMRVKYTQTTVKYGIIVAVGAYADGVTPITVWGGTDYTLEDATIESTYISIVKAPFGFPLEGNKWDVIVTSATTAYQMSPEPGVVYNIGGNYIDVPIGYWDLSYKQFAHYASDMSPTTEAVYTGLSTSASTFSDIYLKDVINIGIDSYQVRKTHRAHKEIVIASKTRYYMNTMIGVTNEYALYNLNSTIPMVLWAKCMYV